MSDSMTEQKGKGVRSRRNHQSAGTRVPPRASQSLSPDYFSRVLVSTTTITFLAPEEVENEND